MSESNILDTLNQCMNRLWHVSLFSEWSWEFLLLDWNDS